jgi:hypothetical protein
MRSLITCLLLLSAPAVVQAGAVYNVSLDTSPLLASAAGPFSVAFQLADGSGITYGDNAAVLTDFLFGGGSASGSPILIGSAVGDLSSGVVLTDAAGVGFFAQMFTPGSVLSFHLALSNNVDGGPTPDAFTIAILDGSFAPIPTLAGSPLDVLAQIDLVSDTPAISTFSGDIGRTPLAGGAAIDLAAPQIAVATPEPASAILAAGGISLLLLKRLRRRLAD